MNIINNKNMTENKTTCCPKFNPDSLDGKELDLSEKTFIKEAYNCFFHIPLNIGSVMKKTCALAEKNNMLAENALWLCDEKNPFKAYLYLETKGEIKEAINEKLEGKYFVKIFEGSYQMVPKWIKELKNILDKKGQKAERFLSFYTTCPKCAKIYGHNYVGIFAKIK